MGSGISPTVLKLTVHIRPTFVRNRDSILSEAVVFRKMTRAAPGFEGRTPQVFAPCKTIEYSRSILAQIRAAALEGQASSHSEILGVLFGRREAGVVRILGFE